MPDARDAYKKKAVILLMDKDKAKALVPPVCRGCSKIRKKFREIGFTGKSERLSLESPSLGQKISTLNYLLSIPTPHILDDYSEKLARKNLTKLNEPAQSFLLSSSTEHEDRLEMPDTFDGEPKDFQSGQIYLASDRKTHLFGDTQGLGKTVEAIATLEHVQNNPNRGDAYPALVTCKPTKVEEMIGEFKDFAPKRSVHVLEGVKNTGVPPFADVYVIHYQILYAWTEVFEEETFKSVVVDESHKIKNEDSGINDSVFAAKDEETNLSLALSGTPVEKGPEEWIETLKFLDLLDYFGGEADFLKRYCGASIVKKPWGIQRELGDPQNLEELNKILRCKVMTRHQIADVYDQLPKKVRRFVPVEVDQSKVRELEEEALDRARETYREKLQDLREKKKEIEKQVSSTNEKGPSEDLTQSLRKVEEKIEETKDRGPVSAVKHQFIRAGLAKLKLDAVVDRVEETMRESEERAIVFGHHRSEPHDVIGTLKERLQEFECSFVVGGQDKKDRKQQKRLFNEGYNRVLVASIKVAGESIDLTGSRRMGFAELMDKPSTHGQAESRVYARLNNPHGVIADYYYIPNTVDEAVVWKLESRDENCAKMLGDDRTSTFNPNDQDVENKSVRDLSEEIMRNKYGKGVE